MNDSSKYLSYTEEDFAGDPLFRRWILAPDAVNSAFWINWLARHPEKEPVMENARWLMLQVRVAEGEIPRERLAAVWTSIQKRKAAVAEEKEDAHYLDLPLSSSAAKVIPLFSFQAFQRIAAIFLLVSFCAGILYYLLRPGTPASQTIATVYGQTRTVLLPDQSQVVLNGNSRLSFVESWSKAEDREVWLQGEAYFSVSPTQNHRKFRVHLKDGVQVTVLGTQFTVTQRPTKTQVVLSEGKVKLTREQEKYFGLRSAILEETVMQPGDLVEVQAKKPRFHKTTVTHPALYAGFTQHKIIFKNTLLSEVARVLQDTYGYRVTLARPDLANQRFSGTTPTGDIDMLFSAIEDLFQVRVIRKEKHIIIQ
jgi:transmembrane sensor